MWFRNSACHINEFPYQELSQIDPTNCISKMFLQVFVGSASEGLLMPGDRVVGINHQDASKLTHLEAQNLMKSAGTTAKVDVVR